MEKAYFRKRKPYKKFFLDELPKTWVLDLKNCQKSQSKKKMEAKNISWVIQLWELHKRSINKQKTLKKLVKLNIFSSFVAHISSFSQTGKMFCWYASKCLSNIFLCNISHLTLDTWHLTHKTWCLTGGEHCVKIPGP